MHESVWQLLEQHADKARGVAVCEVGARSINGSARTLYQPLAASYIGVDIMDAPEVDRIESGEQLPEEWADRFGLVVATEVAEHIERPWRLFSECARVCAPGGWVILTGRGFNESGAFQFHEPPDRWRISLDAARVMLDDAGLLDGVDVLTEDWQVPGFHVVARKLV